MLGGAIHKPKTGETVVVRHTEEVVAGDGGKLPLPKDHLDNTKTLTPEATQGRPIRFINYGGGVDNDGNPSKSAGGRTQIVYSADGVNKMSENCELTFNNTAMGITAQKPVKGDHIRIFWEEEVTGDANADAAVEVTISPDTFPGTLTYTIGLH